MIDKIFVDSNLWIYLYDKKEAEKQNKIEKIIASALENNCNIFFSEDMHCGQLIENRIKIVNPFM